MVRTRGMQQVNRQQHPQRCWRRAIQRALRVLLGMAVLALVVVLALGIVLVLPSGRDMLLRAGLNLADRSLPGTLTAHTTDWSRAGEVSLDGVIWNVERDTLVSIKTLRLHMALKDLWRRDLTILAAETKGVAIDLPALRAHLPINTDHDTIATATSGATAATAPILPFLRSGALPFFPSLAVHRLTIARVALKTSPAHTARLDSLDLSLELRRGREPQIAAALQARPLPALGVSWRLRGTASQDGLDLAVAPLHLAAPSRLPAESTLPLDGRLHLPMTMIDAHLQGKFAWPSLILDRLQIEGDAGTWRLDGRLDGMNPGHVVLYSELPAAPVALLAGLASLAKDSPVTAAGLDTLALRWSEHGPPGLDLTIDFVPPPPPAALTEARLQAHGRFRLPAPAAVEPILPPSLVLHDLGPVDLDLTVDYDGTTTPAAFEARLDLSRTAWLDEVRLLLSGNLEAIHHADLVIRLPGLELSAAGRADRDSVDLNLAIDLPDAALLQRWNDPTFHVGGLAAGVVLHVHGPWSRPRANLHASAMLATEEFTLSGLDITFAGSAVDSLRSLRGLLELSAQSPPAALDVRGLLDVRDLLTSPAVSLTGHHLSLSLDHHALTSTGPWRAIYTTADTTACLTGLRLTGNLGHCDLDGCVRPDSLDAALDLHLRLALDAIRPLLPPEHQATLPDGTLIARGRLTAAGAPEAPWAAGDIALMMTDQPEFDGLGLDLTFGLGGSGPAPAGLDPGRPGWQAGKAQLRCFLRDRDSELLKLDARTPWPLTSAASDSFDLRLNAASLDLARLARLAPLYPMLPPGHGISGTLSCNVRAHGLLPQDVASLAGLFQPGTMVSPDDPDFELSGAVRLQDVGLVLADSTRVALDATVALEGTVRSPRAAAVLALAGDLGRLDVRAQASLDSLDAVADLDLGLSSATLRPYLPVEQQVLLPQGMLAVAGQIEAAGQMLMPWAAGQLQVAVIDQPDLAPLSAVIDMLVGSRGTVPARLEDDRRSWRRESLRLNVRLLDAGKDLLSLSALAPMPHLATVADSVDMRLDAPGLDLARLTPLLPAGTSLTGRLDATTRLYGLMLPGQTDPDLDLAGRLQVTDLRLQLPEGSRLALRGRVDLSGRSLAPQMRGGLHVEGGLIRLPDPPPALLPAAGRTLLQRSMSPAIETAVAETGWPADDALAVDDSTALITPASPQAVASTAAAGQSALPRILPDLIMTLTSPGNLWLRGQGLDVELAGDLSLLVRGDRIALEGELQAVRGTMRQLGRLFRLDRGRVVFDGSETELNPELDLALSVRVGQYKIGIQLGGTAHIPTLRFTSDPELSEGDILATLLFGKPLDELDEGQTGLLASRAAQIAATYGAARLQESLARQLGIDVVSIAPREGDDQTTALVLGKYLSPRVMVRYEQLLREGSAFFVHLDYAFAGAFRLHTQVSQGEESGVQLKWQRDW